MAFYGIYLIYTVFLGILSAITPSITERCLDQPFDIVFVIDTSSSIWHPDFDRQIKFIKDVAERFDIGQGPKQTRIGVISFGESYYLHFHLWQNNRKDLLERALHRIRHRVSKSTNTAAALRYLRKYMFTHRYGSRKYATHVAVVITDGKSQNRKATLQAAEAVRSHGIEIFGIGVGDAVDFRELENVASKPASDYVYEVADFQSLDSMKFVLANRACKSAFSTTPSPSTRRWPVLPPSGKWFYLPEATTAPPTSGPGARRFFFNRPPHIPQRTPIHDQTDILIQADVDPRLNVTNCGGKPADIYFALDASNSIWPEDFKKQLIFVQDLVSLFDISPKKTRVGLVTYSDTVKPIFGFDAKQEKISLINKIANVTFMGGRTRTSEAFKFLREQGFSPDVARREVAHIVLTFTDGLSKNPRDTAREAELAKRKGIYLFSVGIGMSVEKTELADIASEPEDDFVFHVANFSVLNTIKDILAIKACAVQQPDFVADENRFKCDVKRDTDLVFVYDSAQLGMKKTRKITRFVYDVTSGFDMSSGRLKVGRLTENCLSGADVYLTSQKQSMDFDQIYFPDFRRMIRKLAAVGFSPQYGARREAAKVAVLFLDDDNENLKQAAAEVSRLHETHSFVITVGDIDLHTAAEFSSKPLNDYLVHIPSYKYLQTARTTLLHKLCNAMTHFNQTV